MPKICVFGTVSFRGDDAPDFAHALSNTLAQSAWRVADENRHIERIRRHRGKAKADADYVGLRNNYYINCWRHCHPKLR